LLGSKCPTHSPESLLAPRDAAISKRYHSPVDYSRYIWRESKNDKGYFIREAAGYEVLLDLSNLFAGGMGNIFLGVSMSFKASIPTIDVLCLGYPTVFYSYRSGPYRSG
jgi:hypothetical protein